MMRLLVDIEGLEWERAWSISTTMLNYTNHTVMPEALEKWPVKVCAVLGWVGCGLGSLANPVTPLDPWLIPIR